MHQGCGISLDILVSKCTSVSCRFSLDENCQRLGLVRLTSRSRLGVGHLCLMLETNFQPNCAGQIKKMSQFTLGVPCSFHLNDHNYVLILGACIKLLKSLQI